MHEYKIRLTTAQDVEDFVNAIDHTDGDVRIIGKDEHNNDWQVSAKSILLTLCVASRAKLAQKRRAEGKESEDDVDLSVLRCESTEDISSIIGRFVTNT